MAVLEYLEVDVPALGDVLVHWFIKDPAGFEVLGFGFVLPDGKSAVAEIRDCGAALDIEFAGCPALVLLLTSVGDKEDRDVKFQLELDQRLRELLLTLVIVLDRKSVV